MRCGTARALLPLYLDGVLTLGEHQEVAEHLSLCRDCSDFAVRHETPPPPLPPLPQSIMTQFMRDLDQSLEVELNALKNGTSRYQHRPPPRNPMSWPVLWLSGALVGATTSWILFAFLQPTAPLELAGQPSRGDRAQYLPLESFEPSLDGEADQFLSEQEYALGSDVYGEPADLMLPTEHPTVRVAPFSTAPSSFQYGALLPVSHEGTRQAPSPPSP